MIDIKQEAKDFLHDCDRSARYHTARRAFFDMCHRWIMVAVLVSGSSAVATLNGLFGDPEISRMLSMIIMLITALCGAISVVWNLTDRARDHEMLARQFYGIAKLIDVEKADKEQIEKWRVEIIGVYEDEPAVFHALNAECYNAATKALGCDSSTFQQVSWHQHLLRNIRRFSPKDFTIPR